MKVDLHVHSRFSSDPTQWILKKLNCPESFVDPEMLYRLARKRGMDLVTISDHNTIEGALSIAHKPGVFISEEVTAAFPEDRCKVHVLAWGIDEEKHRELQRLRDNVYELAAYLHQEGIHSALAHPLFAVNDKLTPEHLEKLLLLFKVFEENGARDGMQNYSLRLILGSLTPERIDELSEKHGLDPIGDEPWVKHMCAGSDDHSGLNIARLYTEAPDADDIQDAGGFLQAVARGGARVKGVYSTPKALAHNLYGIGYQFYREKCRLGRFVNKDRFLKFLDLSLRGESPDDGRLSTKIKAWIHRSGILRKKCRDETLPTHRLLRVKGEQVFYEHPAFQDQSRFETFSPDQAEEEWFSFAGQAANRAMAHYMDSVLDAVNRARLFDIFGSVAAAGSLYTALSPYFVAYSLFVKDRALCREVLSRIRAEGAKDKDLEPEGANVAHFTDTFYDTNGVALTLREQARLAHVGDKPYTVLTCCQCARDLGPNVKNFAPIGVYDMPEYSDLNLNYPPVLELLGYVYDKGFTHIHSSTPGPMGLAALLIARILKLPISGTYHTAFPQYARELTGDDAMEKVMWRFMLWYYGQMDRIFAPSRHFEEELAGKGVPRERIVFYPRGVDTDRFHPVKGNGYFEKYNLNGGIKILYVGRVSKEKNLHVMTRAFKEIAGNRKDADLVVVGDGPYRREMERDLAGTNCVFTGKLQGEELARAYASCDLLVFPSTTDTFGKVVLEGQASGLPVVVTDVGGPKENILPGVTGLVVKGGDADELKRAVETLIRDRDKLAEMRLRARRYMESRSSAKAFDKTYAMYIS